MTSPSYVIEYFPMTNLTVVIYFYSTRRSVFIMLLYHIQLHNREYLFLFQHMCNQLLFKNITRKTVTFYVASTILLYYVFHVVRTILTIILVIVVIRGRSLTAIRQPFYTRPLFPIQKCLPISLGKEGHYTENYREAVAVPRTAGVRRWRHCKGFHNCQKYLYFNS